MTYYIYKMVHLPSGRVYVGQRKLPKGKTPETDNYYGSGKIWKRIYEKHPDECVKVIIDCAETQEKIDELEKFYIAHYKSVWGDKCVNIARGGYNLREFKHTDEWKNKMSSRNKGEVPWNKGRHLQKETKEKIRKGVTGFKHTEETKRKMSAAKLGKKRGPRSEEEKEKIRLGNIGKKRTAETRKKMSEKAKGRTFSEETRKKLSEKAKLQWRKKKGLE